jgi:hypothetical protein
VSAVRMCDRCGNIFSEREDGWSTFTGSTVKRDQNGQQRATTDQIDTCQVCTTIGSNVTPKLAIDSATGVDRVSKTQTAEDRDRILRGMDTHPLD